jgi:hypothetical protein
VAVVGMTFSFGVDFIVGIELWGVDRRDAVGGGCGDLLDLDRRSAASAVKRDAVLIFGVDGGVRNRGTGDDGAAGCATEGRVVEDGTNALRLS